MTNPSHYFGAGPAAIPLPVKQQIQQDLIQYKNTRVSILELSHRSDEFALILEDARQKLRALYDIPENYHILFMAGGATAQFDAVPLNLLGGAKTATYLDTGFWSNKAAELATKYCAVNIVPGVQEANGLLSCIDAAACSIEVDSAYVHITPNETIEGIVFDDVVKHHTVAADMTSCLIMRPIDFNHFGLIYAGTQKTLGIAGISLVIVREDLLNKVTEHTPALYRYDTHAQFQSIVNTSPVFACYVTQLMLNWAHDHGGVDAMCEQAKLRSQLLYATIDRNASMINRIHPDNRSIINVVFDFVEQGITDEFLAAASELNLDGLRGHRLKGGVRVSMYNGTPMAAVEQLNKLMQEFS